jgi:hypothetical protein
MKSIAITAVAALLTATTFAQQPGLRKPAAEEARLGYFTGNWTFNGETKASPMGPAGKMTGTEACTWFTGGFFVVCQSDGTTPMGKTKGQAIMGYDPGAKTYTYYAFNNMGMGFFVRGNVAGKVWTWNFDNAMDGKTMKGRVTVTEESPTAYAYKMEASIDGGPMSILEEGKATKK